MFFGFSEGGGLLPCEARPFAAAGNPGCVPEVNTSSPWWWVTVWLSGHVLSNSLWFPLPRHTGHPGVEAVVSECRLKPQPPGWGGACEHPLGLERASCPLGGLSPCLLGSWGINLRAGPLGATPSFRGRSSQSFTLTGEAVGSDSRVPGIAAEALWWVDTSPHPPDPHCWASKS